MQTNDFSDIPIIDLTNAGERDVLARRITQVFHEVGFLLVTGHSVAQSTTDAAFAHAKRFFALPREQKQLMDKRRSRHFRGWEPIGTEHTNNQPDIREQIDLWSEHPPLSPTIEPKYLRLLGSNQWPPEDLVPGFKDATTQWVSQAETLATSLLQLMALGLGLAENHFSTLFATRSMSLTKIIHYPPTPNQKFGVNTHHDAGCLTILAPGDTPGLEVENGAGDWIPVPIVPGTLVVNLGEVLQKMTGNYFVATPHRVATKKARQSMGYFHGPSIDAQFEPLPLDERFADAVAASPRHAKAGFMAQVDETESGVAAMASPNHPDVYGEQLWNYFARSYPDNVKAHYPNG